MEKGPTRGPMRITCGSRCGRAHADRTDGDSHAQLVITITIAIPATPKSHGVRNWQHDERLLTTSHLSTAQRSGRSSLYRDVLVAFLVPPDTGSFTLGLG